MKWSLKAGHWYNTFASIYRLFAWWKLYHFINKKNAVLRSFVKFHTLLFEECAPWHLELFDRVEAFIEVLVPVRWCSLLIASSKCWFTGFLPGASGYGYMCYRRVWQDGRFRSHSNTWSNGTADSKHCQSWDHNITKCKDSSSCCC